MEEKKSMSIEQLLEAMTAKMGRSPETMVLLSQVNESAVFEHVANQNFAMSGEHIPILIPFTQKKLVDWKGGSVMAVTALIASPFGCFIA